MSVKVNFRMKVLTGDTIFMFPTGDRSATLCGLMIQAMQRSSHLQGNAVLLSYFKTLSTGPAAQRIKPVSSLTP